MKKTTFLKKRLPILILTIGTLTACGSHNSSRPITLYHLDTSVIKLDFFDTIPETIPTSGGFYSYDTIAITNSKYIFLTDNTTYAVIRINGKDVYLGKEYDKCQAIEKNTFIDVFSGNDFTVTLTHTPNDRGNDIQYETGTLKIKNRKYQAITEVHGHRGF